MYVDNDKQRKFTDVSSLPGCFLILETDTVYQSICQERNSITLECVIVSTDRECSVASALVAMDLLCFQIVSLVLTV